MSQGWRITTASASSSSARSSSRSRSCAQAQEEQQKSGQNLGYTLAKLGYISDDEITNFL